MTGMWRIASPMVEAEVQSLGAMLGPVRFRTGRGWVSPLAVAPWGDDAGDDHAALPGVLKRLRGEWPCVPFGSDADRPGLPPGWHPAPDRPAVRDDLPHGFGANAHWALVARGPDWLHLAIDYPAGHAIAGLERVIRLRADRPAVDIALTIHPRRDCAAPLGLHPVYDLPADPGGLRLDLPDGARAWTFPLPVEPGRSILVPDQRAADPRRLATVGGGPVDIGLLPLPAQSEELVLLTGLEGRIAVDLPGRGCRVVQHWRADHLPACLLWISGQGRRFYPWSGRFRGLGVEPLAAPFDLGPATAAGPNPLREAGIATAVDLTAGRAFVTEYDLSCSDL